jgi:hypothetical protein
MRFHSNQPLRAGEVLHYSVQPGRNYQALQREMLERMEQKKPVAPIQKELFAMFCEHFSIPTRKVLLDFVPSGAWNESDGGITDHYSCHRALGLFEVIVTHPYGFRQLTAANFEASILKYGLLCIIQANAWDFYYPQHTGCFLLIRLRGEAQRRKRKENRLLRN